MNTDKVVNPNSNQTQYFHTLLDLANRAKDLGENKMACILFTTAAVIAEGESSMEPFSKICADFSMMKFLYIAKNNPEFELTEVVKKILNGTEL